ncbi:MAG TPA: DUF6496 domain-containing protein [Lysobacter sp.]|nr:DUF6496 domain-containing protein [Lysobacter sp.]
MPEKRTLKRARRAKREGKSASTQAGEFVHEEIEHIREGKHGARSTKQAIAIGLSKARRAGVDLPPPKKGETSEEMRSKARRDSQVGAKRARKTAAKKATAKKTTAKAASRKPAANARKRAAPSKTRSRAVTKALKRESRAAASKSALSKQAKSAARKRTAAERSAAAKKAARTKGAEGRSEAARKAARTRARNEGPRRKHNGATAHA